MTTRRQHWLLGCGIAVVLCAGLGVALLLIVFSMGGGAFSLPGIGRAVAVVEVFGVLGEDDDVLEQLDAIGEDSSIRALVLHVNSPGGGVGATQRIVSRLESMRDDGLPVVAALESVAASGGYYVACTADSILTLPGTLTGSIGAVMAFPEMSALMTRLGIQFQVVKSGEFKDTGGFHRPMTTEERRWIRGVLEDVLEQFVGAVDQGRPGLDRDEIVRLADGRIFSGRMAVELGLADRIGTVEEAIGVAGVLGGIGADPRVVRKRPSRSWWSRLAEGRVGGLAMLGPARAWPRVDYRWR